MSRAEKYMMRMVEDIENRDDATLLDCFIWNKVQMILDAMENSWG